MQLIITIQKILLWIIPVLFAITIHEVAHGYVAYLLGDKTARFLGRLTLNPIKHIDILGTIILPGLSLLLGTGIIIGWAKPVPIDPRNLQNPKKDMAVISVAGPLSNFIMALFWASLAKAAILLTNSPISSVIYTVGITGININIMLMVLNLVPIPPLDGAHVIANFLPTRLAWQYERLAPYGFIILMLLVYAGVIDKIIFPMISSLLRLISHLFGLPL